MKQTNRGRLALVGATVLLFVGGAGFADDAPDLCEGPIDILTLHHPNEEAERVTQTLRGELIWRGRMAQLLIGDREQRRGAVTLVRYENGDAFYAAFPDGLTAHLTWPAKLIAARDLGTPTLALWFACNVLTLFTDPDVTDSLPASTSPLMPSALSLETLASAPETGPVVMINFLEFHEVADDPEDSADHGRTGREAFDAYAGGMAPYLCEAGGEPVWRGEVVALREGADYPSWHELAIVQYASRADFLGMLHRTGYQATGADRDAGLARTRLIVSEPQ